MSVYICLDCGKETPNMNSICQVCMGKLQAKGEKARQASRQRVFIEPEGKSHDSE